MIVIDEMSKNDVLAFKKREAGDAEDFIIFILEQFHKELQKSGKNIAINRISLLTNMIKKIVSIIL